MPALPDEYPRPLRAHPHAIPLPPDLLEVTRAGQFDLDGVGDEVETIAVSEFETRDGAGEPDVADPRIEVAKARGYGPALVAPPGRAAAGAVSVPAPDGAAPDTDATPYTGRAAVTFARCRR